MPEPENATPNGKVSGRKTVLLLFSGAFLFFAIIFVIAYRQKLADRNGLYQNGAVTGRLLDSATTPDSIRAWMTALPQDWDKVTFVEGQGYVIFIPCYSSNGTLTLRTAKDSVPALDCEYCDSLGDFAVKSIARGRTDGTWEFRLEQAAGSIRILPVDDSLLKHFPEAPFKDKLLLWTRTREGGAIDSMLFVPKSQENEFETLRAEDENPEGCGGGTDSD